VVADVALVDYGSGNVRSLRAALERVGARVRVTADPAEVRAAPRLMVAGQGAAGPAMAALRRRGLVDALLAAVAGGAHLLGVCVGLQLLFERSAEGDTPCLGLLPGTVTHLDGVERLPHMGWNDVEPVGPPHPLAAGLPACAYFAHSYAVRDAGPAAVAETEVDGQRFTSVVAAGRVAGAQFHPERSAGAGLAMLRGFLAWSDAA
jgi:glutamine amidotransferase